MVQNDSSLKSTGEPFSAQRLSDEYDHGDHVSFARIMTGMSDFLNYGYFEQGEWSNLPKAQVRLADFVLREQLNLQPGEVVLDVGCGLGGTTKRAGSKYGANITGVDLDYRKVKQANEAAKNAGLADRVRFIEGDSQNLPFNNNLFDCVYSIESAFHYPQKERFIQGVARVLRPGGRFCLVDFVESGHPLSAKDQAQWADLGKCWEFCRGPQLSSEGWANLMLASGFQEVQTTDISEHVFPAYIRRINRLLRYARIAPLKVGASWFLKTFYRLNLNEALRTVEALSGLMERDGVRYVALLGKLPNKDQS